MLVPRSFKYSTSPPTKSQSTKFDETRSKSKRLFSEPVWSDPQLIDTQPRQTLISSESYPILSPTSMSMRQPSQPVEIPSSRRSSELSQKPSTRGRGQQSSRSRPTKDTHRSDSLPPAVAALLAVTAIPPPRPTQSRRKRSSLSSKRVSIDELVQEWRNDSSLRSSIGSSASLGLLLESTEDSADEQSSYSRSSSCDSLPSLDEDDHSVISVGSPATPESLRSQRSSSLTPRKEKSFCLVASEDCGIDHPLGLPTIDDYDSELLLTPTPKSKAGSRRISSAFKSNLTSSLQALKSRALSSISSFNQAINQADAAFSDETLWQHPHLFPHFSSEIRPTPFASTPSRSQRRYFNPIALSFEEQQHHWRRALSNLGSDEFDAPMIQMQTYRRSAPSSRKARRNSGTPDAKSEAGRALAASQKVPQGRQREVRENSDFLRVIVLEMNMRREGKLEEGSAGRAKIWLPPRQAAIVRENVFEDDEEHLTEGPVGRKIPKRWIGVSAEY